MGFDCVSVMKKQSKEEGGLFVFGAGNEPFIIRKTASRRR